MKLFFSFLLLLICYSARSNILITYDQERLLAMEIVKMLEEKFEIPPILIDKEWKKLPCEPLKQSILQICVDNNKIIHLPVVRSEILKNSFAIFHSQE